MTNPVAEAEAIVVAHRQRLTIPIHTPQCLLPSLSLICHYHAIVRLLDTGFTTAAEASEIVLNARETITGETCPECYYSLDTIAGVIDDKICERYDVRLVELQRRFLDGMRV